MKFFKYKYVAMSKKKKNNATIVPNITKFYMHYTRCNYVRHKLIYQ